MDLCTFFAYMKAECCCMAKLFLVIVKIFTNLCVFCKNRFHCEAKNGIITVIGFTFAKALK